MDWGLALRRLDERNQLWEQVQRDEAASRSANAYRSLDDDEQRQDALAEIENTFRRYRDSDFGRKLYLIQNSIYGVDIQPIATQIAKLRFFISLAIEQIPNDDPADNYGIRPLPNLETRFVAADTLVGLRLSEAQDLLRNDSIEVQREAIAGTRAKHFLASNRQQKYDLVLLEKRHRAQLEQELDRLAHEWEENRQAEIDQRLAQLPRAEQRELQRTVEQRRHTERRRQFDASLADARKVATWDPYDLNASAADYFDPEFMFGVADGFDVVIGNPPYVESRNSLLSDKMKDAYLDQVTNDWGEDLPRGSDLLIYFLARSPKLLNKLGGGCLITQNAWLSTDYGKKFQDFSVGKFAIRRIVDTSAKFFADKQGPQINAVVVVFDNQLRDQIAYEIVDDEMETKSTKTVAASHAMKWGHLAAMPGFFVDMLSEMAALARPRGIVSFGQGLNFPLKELNQTGSTEPVIAKDVSFVATSADGAIRKSRISATRRRRVPALIMPRGVGDRYYCTFNACKAFSYSGVELYLPDAHWESDTHYCLWAFLNSSLAWLFREITGRRNLGGGLLKAEATDLKQLPVEFEFDFAEQAKEVFAVLKHRAPLPLRQEIRTDEHLAIDRMVFDYFGFSHVEQDTREHLLEQVSFRANRSSR